MYRLPLKLRLLGIVASILLATLLIGVWVMVHNARAATLNEIDANLQFSRQFVEFLVAAPDEPLSRENIDHLSRAFRDLRHVRVDLETAPGHWTPLTHNRTLPEAPAWFADLIVPPSHQFAAIDIHGWDNASIRIRATPEDEIAEVWHDMSNLVPLSLAALILVCALVYVGLWLGLAPLRRLHDGFHRLEARDFNVRLSGRAVPELADTQRRFNRLVAVLERSIEERRALTRRLVDTQERERRTIARELHDEMAPYLFGLRSQLTAFSLAANADHSPEVETRVSDMHDSLSRLQQQIQKMLKRLRPAVLDDFGLADSLAALLEEWRERDPRVQWRMMRCEVDNDLDDAIQVTAYRSVQESLTNVARHAQATRATVSLWQTDAPEPTLIIRITDNGRGGALTLRPGIGLTGARERVDALNGRLIIEDAPAGGLVVSFYLRLRASSRNQADRALAQS